MITPYRLFKLTHLLTLSSLIALAMSCSTIFAQDYPVPKPPTDMANYGKHFQRSMTLMATSTPEKQNTVKILFYGQSIVGQQWHTMVAEDLKKRFPNTNFIIKNKALGGFSSPRLVRTMFYDVLPFYPDLIVFHVYGAHDKYEDIMRNLRTLTAAEIIMQSDHANTWPEPKCTGNFWAEQKEWGDKMNYFLLPEIAKKYKCSWQPQRWEWVDYLKDNNLEPKDLLKDSVHLNEQGRWLMAELLKRYLVYLPNEPKDEWQNLTKTIPVSKNQWKDDTLTIQVDGNRIVALAAKDAQGTFDVLIDGKKVTDHPECYTFTRPTGTPHIGWPAIQRMTWINPPVLEEWEFTCKDFSDDHKTFKFSLAGSVTGPDGAGKVEKTFVSNSGRVVVEPTDWVYEFDRAVSKKPAPDGHTVRFKVELMGTDSFTTPTVENAALEYPTVLASNLDNGPHTVTLKCKSGSTAAIKAIVVYKPPFTAEDTK